MLREQKIFSSGRGEVRAHRDFTFPSICYRNIKYKGRNFKKEIFTLLEKYTSLVSEMPKMR